MSKNIELLCYHLIQSDSFTKQERQQLLNFHKYFSDILKNSKFSNDTALLCKSVNFLQCIYKYFQNDLKEFISVNGDKFSEGFDFTLSKFSKNELDQLVEKNFWFRALISRSRDLIAFKLDVLSVQENFWDQFFFRCGFFSQWVIQLAQFVFLAVILKLGSGYLNKKGVFKRFFGQI